MRKSKGFQFAKDAVIVSIYGQCRCLRLVEQFSGKLFLEALLAQASVVPAVL